MIRPDAAVYSLAFGAVLLALSVWSWRGAIRTVALAAAIPALYEVFRAGYFGSLLPNTALAKEAGESHWAEGGRYLADFVRVQALWIPLVVLVIAALSLVLARLVPKRLALLWAVTAAAGLMHAAWVVRVGGDFMHARLLLPDWFLLVLPLAALPWTLLRRPVMLLGGVMLVGWSVWATVSIAPAFQSKVAPGVVDERTNYVANTRNEHPVTLADHHRNVWTTWGWDARRRAEAGRNVLIYPSWHQRSRVTPARAGTYLVWPNIGMLGYAAGPDVYVVDGYGLADPVAARLQSSEERAGHSKVMGLAWIEARFSSRSARLSPDATAAARVLACPPLQDLLDATRSPLTPKLFVKNLLRAPRLTGLRIPDVPQKAVVEQCPRR
jgi:arabinofuranosyltransferase